MVEHISINATLNVQFRRLMPCNVVCLFFFADDLESGSMGVVQKPARGLC